MSSSTLSRCRNQLMPIVAHVAVESIPANKEFTPTSFGLFLNLLEAMLAVAFKSVKKIAMFTQVCDFPTSSSTQISCHLQPPKV